MDQLRKSEKQDEISFFATHHFLRDNDELDNVFAARSSILSVRYQATEYQSKIPPTT